MRYLEIKTEKLPALIDEMNTLLSNYQLYYQKLRNFHWNVRGENFFELHELFEKFYKDAQLKIDAIAERIQTLKYRPLSLLRRYLERAEIEEIDDFLDDRQMVNNLLADQQILIKNMKRAFHRAEAADDYATMQLMQTNLLGLEKFSWMLDTWMEKAIEVEMEIPVTIK